MGYDNDKIVIMLVVILFCFCNIIFAQIEDEKSFDSDNDGLSDVREKWWLSDPNKPDTTGTNMIDGTRLSEHLPPFSTNRLNKTTDYDNDGLPDSAEIYEVGTDPKKFSSDADLFSDGEEFFGIDFISFPENHYFVAAYPRINIEIKSIEVIPHSIIESKTGGLLINNWSIYEETIDSKESSAEIGAGLELDLGKLLISSGGPNPLALGKALSVEIGGDMGWNDTNIAKKKNTTSGWDQRDWSTITKEDTSEAAELIVKLEISNKGSQSARDISFKLNMFCGNDLKKTISLSNDQKIPSLRPGESIERTTSGILVSTDQLRCIDTGIPIKFKPIDLEWSVSRWERDEWNAIDFRAYMEQIDTSDATLVFNLNNRLDKEYKVYAGSHKSPMTLRDAMNLTIFEEFRELNISNISSNGNRGLNIIVPNDAKAEILRLNGMNKTIFDLNLTSGWKIIFNTPKANTYPVIHWAKISNDCRKIFAAISAEDGINTTYSQILIEGVYKNVSLIKSSKDSSIFEADISNYDLQEITNVTIVAIDENGDYVNYFIDVNDFYYIPLIKDGEYRISVKHSMKCLEGSGSNQDYNVYQNLCRNNNYQIWQIKNVGNGQYIITNHDGMILEVDAGRIEDMANVQLGKMVDDIKQYQKWQIDHSIDGYYRICALHSGKCLSIDQNWTFNGASAVQETYRNTSNQKYVIQPAFSYHKILSESYIFENELNKKIIEVSLDINDTIGLFDYWSGNNQKWDLRPNGDGYFKIVSNDSGKCMEANNRSSLNLCDCRDDDSQRWTFKERSNGTYIIALTNNKCLGINEDKVEVMEYKGYPSQRWHLISPNNYSSPFYFTAENMGSGGYLSTYDACLPLHLCEYNFPYIVNKDLRPNPDSLLWNIEPAGDGHFKIKNKQAKQAGNPKEENEMCLMFNYMHVVSDCVSVDYNSLKETEKDFAEWKLDYLGSNIFRIQNIGNKELYLTAIPNECYYDEREHGTECRLYVLKYQNKYNKNNFIWSQWRINYQS